jgi:hypothetical protein
MYHGDQIAPATALPRGVSGRDENAPIAPPRGVSGRRAGWPGGEDRGLTPRFSARAA